MIDADGNWDGVCACGKREADGVKCFLGATHQPLQPMPWTIKCDPVKAPEELFPWMASDTSVLSGTTETAAQSFTPWKLGT